MDKPLFIVHTSESRKPLFEDYFMKSFKDSGLWDLTELLVYDFGRDSLYGQEAFFDGVQVRLEHLNEAYDKNRGRLIVSVGDDLYFHGTSDDILGEIRNCLKNHDIAAMHDGRGLLCCCLIAGYSNDTTRNLMFEWVRSRDNMKDRPCDQARFNKVIMDLGISYGLLPDTFWTHGLVTGERFIDDITKLPDPPKDILVHHANYCMTTECKIRLIEEIKKRITK